MYYTKTYRRTSSPINVEWTHLAATFNGPTIKLYVNGNLEATTEIDNIPISNKYGYVEPKPLERIYSESDILIGHNKLPNVAVFHLEDFYQA